MKFSITKIVSIWILLLSWSIFTVPAFAVSFKNDAEHAVMMEKLPCNEELCQTTNSSCIQHCKSLTVIATLPAVKMFPDNNHSVPNTPESILFSVYTTVELKPPIS